MCNAAVRAGLYVRVTGRMGWLAAQTAETSPHHLTRRNGLFKSHRMAPNVSFGVAKSSELAKINNQAARNHPRNPANGEHFPHVLVRFARSLTFIFLIAFSIFSVVNAKFGGTKIGAFLIRDRSALPPRPLSSALVRAEESFVRRAPFSWTIGLSPALHSRVQASQSASHSPI